MTFPSFRLTSKDNKKMFKNPLKNPSEIQVKSNPEAFKNHTQKTMGKKTHKIDKKSEFSLPTRSLGEGREVSFRHFFDTFSSPGVPGTSLGKKWSQDLPQEPPGPLGPQFSRFFVNFVCLFLLVLIVLRPIPGTVAGAGPQGNWIPTCERAAANTLQAQRGE